MRSRRIRSPPSSSVLLRPPVGTPVPGCPQYQLPLDIFRTNVGIRPYGNTLCARTVIWNFLLRVRIFGVFDEGKKNLEKNTTDLA